MSYANERKLELPQETEFKNKEGLVTKWFYNDDGFRQILKIYATYNATFDINLKLKQKINNLEFDILILENDTKDCKENYKIADETIQTFYKQRKVDLKYYKKEKNKNKIQTILFTTGGVVVGLGAGILIGFFAVR